MSEEKRSTGALVLGILSLVFWVIPPAGLPIGIVGVVLGSQGINEKRRFAKAALICSIIGLTFTVINAAVGAYLGATGQLF